MLHNMDRCRKYDLSSVRLVTSGAAPLGEETVRDLQREYPGWCISQAYGKSCILQTTNRSFCFLRTRPNLTHGAGMTETSTVVSWTSEDDVVIKSAGSLLPGAKAKIVSQDGSEVTQYDTPGELYVQAPSVVLGYLHNEKATDETFVYHIDGRWIRTGDEAIITLAPSGNEHLVIVDRIKELIKVKVGIFPFDAFSWVSASQ
jgi:acyl-CoA synthetase (AMP-forming)/AMP-acid ligase II